MAEVPEIYIGIDQTGAVDSRGNPRPLPACAWLPGQKTPVFRALPSLSRLSFEQAFRLPPRSRVTLVLDAALGLPASCGVSFEAHLARAKTYQHQSKSFGMKVAHQFFLDYLGVDPKAPYPKRRAEVLANANSVFRLHPFQKNISCGSFRCLKELAQDEEFRPGIWPFEGRRNGWILLEGYPSLEWRLLYNSPTRNRSTLERAHPRFALSRLSPDQLDAFVLAQAARKLSPRLLRDWKRRLPVPALRIEGWILGVEPPHPSIEK